MRGVIQGFDSGAGTGVITGDDGQAYGFGRSSFTTPATVRDGLRVDFSPVDGQATQIILLEAAPPTFGQSSSPWNESASAPTATSTAIDWQRLFFSFNGRLRRSHYWIGWAIIFGVGLLLNFIPLIGGLLSIVLLWPHLAIGARRLHDMGHTGWLIAIPYGITVLGYIYVVFSIGTSVFTNPDVFDNGDPAEILAVMGPAMGAVGLVWLVGIAFWLWMGIQEGQHGENRFGANPKNPADSDVFH